MMLQTKRIDKLRRLILLTIFGVIMYLSQLILSALPNIHMIALFITVLTVVYRKWALISIYTYAFLNGMYGVYVLVPYLYVWTVLWAVIMLLPKNMKPKVAVIIYSAVCGFHGLLFGIIYAPSQAILFGFTFAQTIAWIANGLLFDVFHCIGNIVFSMLAYPLINLLMKLESKAMKKIS